MANGTFTIKTLAGFVTASIFSGCIIPPLFQSFWQVSADKGFSLFENYKNSLYMNAAVGNRNWIDYLVLTILIVLVTLLPIVLLIAYSFRSTKKKNKAAEEGRKLTLSLVLAPILLTNFLAGLLVINYAYSDLQLNASFEQYIAALRPSLSDAEERRWRSSWALMESEADCYKIFESITKKSQEAGIALPRKLYF
jgi:hypothetical protein